MISDLNKFYLLSIRQNYKLEGRCMQLMYQDHLKFRCLNCGRCCHEVQGPKDDPTYKRIPLYPEEADRLERLAKERNIPLRMIEDLVFPDEKNKKILIVTYRILLDNEEKVCPFHKDGVGCTIHDQKPLACQAYPLSLSTEDAFNMKITIDPLCEFTVQNREIIEKINYEQLKNIYDIELLLAKNHLARNKQLLFNLNIREREGSIHIPRKIDNNDFDRYLKEWDRENLES
jgi:Fe-S-cluster containining protein